MQGDCLSLMNTLPDNCVQLTLTDIPYGEVNRSSGGLRNLDKAEADEVDFDIPALAVALCRVTTGSIYVFCGVEQISSLRAEFVKNGMTTRLGIWEKTNPSPMNGEHLWLSGTEACVFARWPLAPFNERCQSPVWRYPSGSSNLHPTQKPLGLFRRLILASSDVGQTVFDPFMGSGTAGVACVETNRKFIGIERDARHFATAKRRMIDTTAGLFDDDTEE